MKKVYFYLIFLAIFYISSIRSQAQVKVVWDRAFGNANSANFYALAPANGGGYLISGYNTKFYDEGKYNGPRK